MHLAAIPKIKLLEEDVSEAVLPIKNSNQFFCLLSTNYNRHHTIELQKLSNQYGNTYFLDYITYTTW